MVFLNGLTFPQCSWQPSWGLSWRRRNTPISSAIGQPIVGRSKRQERCTYPKFPAFHPKLHTSRPATLIISGLKMPCAPNYIHGNIISRFKPLRLHYTTHTLGSSHHAVSCFKGRICRHLKFSKKSTAHKTKSHGQYMTPKGEMKSLIGGFSCYPTIL